VTAILTRCRWCSVFLCILLSLNRNCRVLCVRHPDRRRNCWPVISQTCAICNCKHPVCIRFCWTRSKKRFKKLRRFCWQFVALGVCVNVFDSVTCFWCLLFSATKVSERSTSLGFVFCCVSGQKQVQIIGNLGESSLRYDVHFCDMDWYSHERVQLALHLRTFHGIVSDAITTTIALGRDITIWYGELLISGLISSRIQLQVIFSRVIL